MIFDTAQAWAMRSAPICPHLNVTKAEKNTVKWIIEEHG